ncbi:contractile injection system tape measure protein [Tenacibaculum sp. nBUS_03]|uniref:contractile injection system tape measure protein n=1 Tax=Tenacibaculum sp. nBUS_03 TaxID=3395320 RepID=UPI003EBC7667
MITSTEHSIEKVFVEVNTKSKKVANEYKNSIETFLQEEVFPRIEEYFNSLEVESNSEVIIQQISKLAIDVDVSKQNRLLNFKEVKQEIKQQVIEKLEAVLDSPESYEVQINPVTISKSKVNTFFYFLENGTYPWWNNTKTDSGFSKKTLFEITENKNFQTKFLNAIKNKKIKERLINQFFDDELCLLFLSVSNKPKGLKEVLSFISKTKIISEENRKNIWFYIVEAVLVKDFFKVINVIEKNNVQLKDKKQLNKSGIELKENHTELHGGFNTTRDDLDKKGNLKYVLDFFYVALPELKKNKESEKEDAVNYGNDTQYEKITKEQIFKKGKEVEKINDAGKEKEILSKNKKEFLLEESEVVLPKRLQNSAIKVSKNKETLKEERHQKTNNSIKNGFKTVDDNIELEAVNDITNKKPREGSEILSTASTIKELFFEKDNVKINKKNKVNAVNKKSNTAIKKLRKDVSLQIVAEKDKKEQGKKLNNQIENSKKNEAFHIEKDINKVIEKKENITLGNKKENNRNSGGAKNLNKREDDLINEQKVYVQEPFEELNNQITKDKIEVVNQAKSYFVENAGLILIHPFLKQFFTSCNFLNAENKITKPIQAIHLLHYVATKKERQIESNLVFEKFLCNVPINHSIPRNIKLSEELKAKAEELMKAVTQNWEVLKKSSPDLIRNEFIQRVGKLDLTKDTPSITIERKVHDILLDKLPWNYSMCKLPWMKGLIFTNW